MTKKTMVTHGLLVSGCAFSLSFLMSPFSSGQVGGSYAGFGHVIPRRATVKNQRLETMFKQESVAEIAGNYKKAEALCAQMMAEGLPQRIGYHFLYAIYTKEGRVADAYKALKLVVTDTPGSGSSYASDSVLLTKFGQLSEKMGKQSEADLEFLKATKAKTRYLDRRFYPSVSAASTHREVKSAALFFAGIQLCFHHEYSEAVDALRCACKLDSQDWKPHYALAYALHIAGRKSEIKETVAEVKKALRLVPQESEVMLRNHLRIFNIPGDAEFATVGRIDNQGKLHVTVVHVRH